MSKHQNLIKQRADEELAESVGERTALTPPVDIYENRDEFLLVADLPGVTQDGIKIHLEDDRLNLLAPRGAEYAYRRSFLLPEGVDFAQASAELKHGVLSIRIPKAAAARPRRIPVSAG